MRPIHFAAGFACLVSAHAAWAQDSLPPKPAPQTRAQAPLAPKPPKSHEALPASAPTDPIEVDQREQKRLDEKLNSICRGC